MVAYDIEHNKQPHSTIIVEASMNIHASLTSILMESFAVDRTTWTLVNNMMSYMTSQ